MLHDFFMLSVRAMLSEWRWMVSINLEEVEYIAGLARLQFSNKEKAELVAELNSVLTYMEKLNELNTQDVEPLCHPAQITNVMREDETMPSLPTEEALKNASSIKDKFFKVPKVIK